MATLKNHPGLWLRDDAAVAFDKAEDEHGVLIVNSAGRTEAEQQALINRWIKGGAANRPPYLYAPAIPASSSNHVRDGGHAVDVADYRTFALYCGEYGFVHSFPGNDPVHFDYFGVTQPTGLVVPNQVTKDRQVWLNASRNAGLVPDGIEGPNTKAAYARYQNFLRAYGYTGTIDGIWGAGTQNAHQKYFDAKNAPAAPAPASNVTTASFGRVDVVQRALKTKYPLYAGKLVIDNVNGPATKAAVREFQRRAGLTVDGIAGPATRRALGL